MREGRLFVRLLCYYESRGIIEYFLIIFFFYNKSLLLFFEGKSNLIGRSMLIYCVALEFIVYFYLDRWSRDNLRDLIGSVSIPNNMSYKRGESSVFIRVNLLMPDPMWCRSNGIMEGTKKRTFIIWATLSSHVPF